MSVQCVESPNGEVGHNGRDLAGPVNCTDKMVNGQQKAKHTNTHHDRGSTSASPPQGATQAPSTVATVPDVARLATGFMQGAILWTPTMQHLLPQLESCLPFLLPIHTSFATSSFFPLPVHPLQTLLPNKKMERKKDT